MSPKKFCLGLSLQAAALSRLEARKDLAEASKAGEEARKELAAHGKKAAEAALRTTDLPVPRPYLREGKEPTDTALSGPILEEVAKTSQHRAERGQPRAAAEEATARR